MGKIYVIPEENLDRVLAEMKQEDDELQMKMGTMIGRLFSIGEATVDGNQ